MAYTTPSPNMSLPVPIVGVDPGPQYGTDIVSCFTILDGHNHSAGSGVAVTPGGMNINTDLSFANNNLTQARSLRLFPQTVALAAPTDIGCLYEVVNDLYYNDGLGNQVRITQSGAVAGTPGSIGSLTAPASATYVSANATFVWQSDVNTPANLDAASIILRNLTASSFGVTLSPSNALGADYALVLPTLPASQKFMTLDNAGNMAAPWAVDNSTIEVSSNTVQVKALGIGTAQIAAQAITAAKIANNTITASQIAAGTITGTEIVSGVNLAGVAQAGSQNIVVSNTNGATALSIIRGVISSVGGINFGEGFTVTHNATGVNTIDFTVPFTGTPSLVATLVGTAVTGSFLYVTILATTGAQIQTYIGGTPTNIAFNFVAIGLK